MSKHVAPPTGMPPPETAIGPHGEELDLVAIARDTCASYGAEFPDERERYGPSGADWCRHDCQHLLNETDVAARLNAGAEFVGSRPSFLD